MNMPPLVVEVGHYMWKRYPQCQAWTWPIALSWIYWHLVMGYMAVVKEDNISEKIIGLGVVRPVRNPGDGFIPYEHDEDGQVLFADPFICDHPIVLPTLTAAFISRFGPRKYIAYPRGDETSLKIRDYDKFKRRVAKEV